MASAHEAMLSSSSRTRLVSVGDPERRSLEPLSFVLGLTVEQQTTGSVDVSRPDLRGVLVFLDDGNHAKIHSEIVRLIDRNIFEYGALLVVVAPNPALAQFARAQAIDALPKRKNPRIIKGSLPEFGAVSLFSDGDVASTQREKLFLDAITRFLRQNPPETPADGGLNITIDDEGHFWTQDEILLRRAFRGFTHLHLTKELGGRSKDCAVWRVEAQKGAHNLEPFIAKAAVRDELTYEYDTYRDMVRDHVSFPFRAPLLDGCFVRGASRALLVSAFVTRAQRFDEFLMHTSTPELVVASVFQNALSNWRRHAQLNTNISVGDRYVQAQEEALRANASASAIYAPSPLLPDPQNLATAYADCKKHRFRASPPSVLWTALRHVPKASHYISGMHGDLNIRNIFVRWHSSDSILIDFSNSGDKDFLSRDPAKMETSIALLCKGNGKPILSEKYFRGLYRPPLLPLRDLYIGDGRVEAIRQIRKQARGEGIDDPEYALVVACHLLRFSQNAPGAQVDRELDRRRALSYSLACVLIERYKG